MKMLQDQFSYYVIEAIQVYEKFTRASYQNNYFIPLLNTSQAQRSMKYQGPLIWKALDAYLKTCKTLQSFKTKLKNLLLQKYDQETSLNITTIVFNYLKNFFFNNKILPSPCFFPSPLCRYCLFVSWRV